MMKHFLILVAVLLSTATTAKVPQETGEISEVTLQIPLHEPSSYSNDPPNTEAPVVKAHVVEILPNLLNKPDEMQSMEMVTELPVVGETTVLPQEMEPVVPTIVLATKNEENIEAIGPINPPPIVPIADVQNTATVPLDRDPVKRKMRAVIESDMETNKDNMNTDGNVEALTPENPCDLQCTKFDFNPVCATNGECVFEFSNQCIMDTFMCVHPDLGFKATNDDRCSMHWLKHCTEEDLKG